MYILSSFLCICCSEFTTNFYLRLIRFLAVQEAKLQKKKKKKKKKKTQLRWTRFTRLFSLRSLYHIQKQCNVPEGWLFIGRFKVESLSRMINPKCQPKLPMLYINLHNQLKYCSQWKNLCSSQLAMYIEPREWEKLK